jgi:WD40 repeat protein
VYSLVVSPDETVLTGGDDDLIRAWDPKSGKELFRLKTGHRHVLGLSLSQDGKTLASCGNDGQARLWKLPRREMSLETAPEADAFPPKVYRVAITSDTRLLAWSGAGGFIYLWDVEKRKQLHRLVGPEKYGVNIAVSPDRKLLVAGSDNGTLHIWDVASGKKVRELAGHRGRIADICFSPDGRLMATASWDTIVLVWDVAKMTSAK